MLPLVTPKAPGALEVAFSAMKPFVPIPALLILLPALWWFFRDTWKELDDDATRWRLRMAAEGQRDFRPIVALTMCAVIMTLQEYYGGRAQYDEFLRPWLVKLAIAHPRTIKVAKYDELCGFGWWAATRIGGYLLPLPIWKICFRQDSLLDMGFRVRGFFRHARIYLLFLVIVVPTIFLVSRQPDFGTYYPFYKTSSRSWYDLMLWE